jgi:hypothetical protein
MQKITWVFSFPTKKESYFHQVPEEFRQDHIKAISAVKGANLEREFAFMRMKLSMFNFQSLL